jgi:hypothetical protein
VNSLLWILGKCSILKNHNFLTFVKNKVIMIKVIFFFLALFLTTQILAQVDTNFCRTFTNFVIFNETQNNAKELDLEEMGLDTIQRDGEDDLDFTLRKTRANISRFLYDKKEVYSVHYNLYNPEDAFIINDLDKKFAYYKETINLEGFSPDYAGSRTQLISMFEGCASYSKAKIIKEPFNKNEFLSKELQTFYDGLFMDVYRIDNPLSNLRIVLNTNTSASLGHLYIILVNKEFVKEVITK